MSTSRNPERSLDRPRALAPVPRRVRARRSVAALEVLIAAGLVVLDVGIPTIVVLLVVALSLTLRREGPGSLGLVKPARPGHTVVVVLGLTLVWTAFQFGLTMPVLNRVTGEQQEMGVFADLEGDLALLVTLLAVSWALAAVGEEIVYRGFVPVRMAEALGGGRAAGLIGVVVAAVLFALAHLEQGQVGVALTFLDALFFSFLRIRCGSLWASVLGHGLSNTIGLTTFFLVGPVYGLW